MELGTSAKMLSIVPLMAGGGCSKPVPAVRRPSTCSSSSKRTTCAGIRSANSSRWRIARTSGQSLQQRQGASVLAKTLDQANGKFLDSNKSPARKVGELDNRGSHFYLAMYWAQALAAQNDDAA
jgi:isocitrate dehydrogenase